MSSRLLQRSALMHQPNILITKMIGSVIISFQSLAGMTWKHGAVSEFCAGSLQLFTTSQQL
jgi:hypothetical protein